MVVRFNMVQTYFYLHRLRMFQRLTNWFAWSTSSLKIFCYCTVFMFPRICKTWRRASHSFHGNWNAHAFPTHLHSNKFEGTSVHIMGGGLYRFSRFSKCYPFFFFSPHTFFRLVSSRRAGGGRGGSQGGRRLYLHSHRHHC